MTDDSKARMNLAAIKKVDPYARDIVGTSSHVAFYVFNSEQNEWEKTDVEGAFFIYSRNAQPFHSIFVNNRLNTTSFVEPITSRLELQSQPPFLLYRNERSRIRGFWFYNSQECDRIGNLVNGLIQKSDTQSVPNETREAFPKQSNINIFNMLTKAQQEYNNTTINNSVVNNNTNNNNNSNMQQLQQQQQQQTQQQKTRQQPQLNLTSGNVMEFFAAAKPTTTEVPFFQRTFSNPISVDQLEKQQRAKTPHNEEVQAVQQQLLQQQQKQQILASPHSTLNNALPNFLNSLENSAHCTPSTNLSTLDDVETSQLSKLLNASSLNRSNRLVDPMLSPLVTPEKENLLRKMLCGNGGTGGGGGGGSIGVNVGGMADSTVLTPLRSELQPKPALMPPTMFDKPLGATTEPKTTTLLRQEPLNQSQLVQAFTFLLQNDDEFVQKLHDAYLKTFTKQTLLETYH